MNIIYAILTALALSFPLPDKTYVTSGFMEPRPHRFHAGLDFGTYEKIGIPVIAPENGEIYHVHIFVGGYGKALYMKGRSGKIYVFAHLSRFRDDINRDVLRRQFKTYRYPQSMYFSRQFPVTQNEVIAYTGATGLFSPHLHFEIRSPLNHPINPIYFFRIKDTIPPEIDSIQLIPLSSNSVINGLPIPMIVQGGDTIDLRGKFGFISFCKDFIDDMKYPTVPYSISVIFDKNNKTVFRADSFSYERNSIAAWKFVKATGDDGIRLYDNYLKPNISVYKSDRPMRISIVAKDFSGNCSEFSFFIRTGRSRRKTMPPDSNLFFKNDVVQIITGNKRLPHKNAILLKRIKYGNKYHLFFAPIADTMIINSDTFFRFTDKPISLETKNYTIKVRSRSLREPVIAKIKEKNDTLKLLFSDTPFEKAIIVTNKNYRTKEILVNSSNGNFIGTKRSYIRGDISLTTKSDTTPPFLKSAYKKADTVFVTAGDADSRISFNSSEGFFAGKRLLVTPDSSGFKLISDRHLPKKGLFIFQCNDLVGNKLLYKKRFNR